MLKLMSYNIHFGGLGRSKCIADVINEAQPDVVVLQEATAPHIVEHLAELTEMPHIGARPRHSLAFLSRQPVRHYEWHHHPRLHRAVLEIDLKGIRIFGVHLRATHSNYTERIRMREIGWILNTLERYRDDLHIVVGDFNTLAPGEPLNMRKLPAKYKVLAMLLGGRVRFRAIQMMLDAGYLDCYRHLHTDPGFTFPAWDPHVRLDYLFTPKGCIDHVQSCYVMKNIHEPAQATDHLPLLAEISAP